MKLLFCLFLLLIVGCTTNVNEKEIAESQSDWYGKYKNQKNVPKPEDTLLNTDPEPDLKEGFTDLYNKKDLTGWVAKGGTCTFEAEGDIIVGTCVKGSRSTYLSTLKEYSNFVYTCEIKWIVDGNTGVMFRAAERPGKKGKTVVFGPQAEMEGFARNRGWSGGIYGQSCGGYYYPLWLNAHKEARDALLRDGWNRITVKAEGKVVKTWINGIPAAHWVSDLHPKGFFGLQIHSGKKGTVHFRDIKVKEL